MKLKFFISNLGTPAHILCILSRRKTSITIDSFFLLDIISVASELNDPICHSDECQIGSFSSEATIFNSVTWRPWSGAILSEHTYSDVYNIQSSHDLIFHLLGSGACTYEQHATTPQFGYSPGTTETNLLSKKTTCRSTIF